jgi:hypothetical protein
MGRACSTNCGEEESIFVIGREAGRRQATEKEKAYVGK